MVLASAASPIPLAAITASAHHGPFPGSPRSFPSLPLPGKCWGGLQGDDTHPVHTLPIARSDSEPGAEGAAVSRGALPGMSGPGCLTQR